MKPTTTPLPTTLLVANQICVTSQLAANGAGQVVFSWGPLSGRLTPDEARACACSLFMAAEAAQTDEFVQKFTHQVDPEASARQAELLTSRLHEARARHADRRHE